MGWCVRFAVAKAASLVVTNSTTTPSSAVAPQFSSPWSALINMILALVVVVALVIVLIRFLAKRANVQSKGGIQVLAARQLAPNRSVQVIDVQGKRFLIGVGDQVNLLAEVTEHFPSVNDDAPTDNKFADALSDALRTVRKRYRVNKTGEGSE